MAALRKIPSKDELNKLIAEMEQKDLDGYTDRSVAAFKAALSVAKTVAADADRRRARRSQRHIPTWKRPRITWSRAEKPGTGNSGKGSTSANVGNCIWRSGCCIRSPGRGQPEGVCGFRHDGQLHAEAEASAYCFKMTVVNGNAMAPGFTAGNGEVLKTQFVAKIGNDYYYRVYATGTPGQSTGVYTTLPGNVPVKHCAVTIG